LNDDEVPGLPATPLGAPPFPPAPTVTAFDPGATTLGPVLYPPAPPPPAAYPPPPPPAPATIRYSTDNGAPVVLLKVPELVKV
jgi:hypothetical protein